MSVVASIAALALSTGAAFGATITVNYDTDAIANDGLCTLVEAITAVNTQTPSGSQPGECPAGDPGPNTIVLDADNTFGPVQPLETTGYTIDAGVNLTITGAGSDTSSQSFTSIDASDVSDRVFQVDAGAALTLRDLAVLDGKPPAGEDGGGILNHGSLTLDGARVAGNTTGAGGNGAGIANTGSLALNNSTVTGNVAGRTANGGGIYNTGTLALTDSSVTGNHTGTGDVASIDGGTGGGISSAGGTVTLVRSTVSGNVTGDGADGATVDSGNALPAGPGGDGGGIFNAGASTLVLTDSTVSNNQTGAGGPGGLTRDGSSGSVGGRGGDGGGVASAGALTITGSTISGNTTGDGGIGGHNGTGVPVIGGRGGQGAGISASAALQATNVTITGNSAGAGGRGGDGPFSGVSGGAGGGGGGVVQTAGSGVILNATLAGNAVGGGGVGTLGTSAASGANGAGEDLLRTGGTLTLTNSIATAGINTGCSGTITDGGHNLRFPLAETSCPGTGGDPALGQLKDNGGHTQTMALGPTSAAFDKVPPTGAQCPATDQRGTQRPQGAACDIGAYEATAAVVGATPGSLTFTGQTIGRASAPQTVSVADTGEAPAEVSGATITGADASDFTISANGCKSLTVSIGVPCSVGVVFKPTAVGTRTASLEITDASGTQTVSLSGTGTAGGGKGSAPTARLLSAKVVGTRATLAIACGSGSGQCNVSGVLTITERLKGRKIVAITAAATSKKVKKRIVTLATGTVKIAANAKGTIVLKLSKTGTRLLAAHHGLKATLTVTQHRAASSVKIAKRVLRFRAAKKRKH